MKRKTYRFTYHFNKPEWRKQKAICWTIHWRGKCQIVHNINCRVPTYSATQKRQPVAVIKGDAHSVEFVEEDGKVTGIIS